MIDFPSRPEGKFLGVSEIKIITVMSLVGTVYILLLIVKYVESSSHERRLYEDLLRDYSTNERPILNYSKPITVSLKVALQQLIDVDEKNEMVNVNAWLNFAWSDYKLRWDPTEYGNITDLRFPVSMVWKPDVLLYNSVDTTFDSTFPSNVIVYNSGSVAWIPPGIFRISCKINIRFFPFDEQRCSFKFGSWTYSGRRLDLQPAEGGFDVSEYIENGEWTIKETKVTRNEKYYECCPNDPYLDLTFSLQLRRRTLYYGFNLIMPGILTTTVTLLGFSLPPDAGEKITLQITVLLSICFFLTMLSEMSPPTSEAVPLLGLFFSSCLIVVTLSTMFTVYVMNLHYSNPTTQRMGPWTRKLLLKWIPYLLRIKRPGVELKWKDLPPLFGEGKEENRCSQLIRNVMSIEEGLQGSCESGELLKPFMKKNKSKLCLENIESIVKSGLPNIQASLILSLQDILDEVTIVTDKILMEESDKAEARDWRFAALVVDKLCLHVFTFFIFGTVIGVMMMAPYLVA